jgi:hypothetical protein
MRLGCDPEVFLLNQDAELVSAIGKIGGNKYSPLQIHGLKKGFTLQEDNVALEFGIPPAGSCASFVKHIETVMKEGLSKVPGHAFSQLSCAKFPKKELMHPAAQVFGCEPDYNAWTGEENPKPQAPDPTLRSAGGHVHIETELDKNEVGKACDLFLGIPAMLMDAGGEERRQLYGKPGSVRYKPYGVEYRTLSNFWIFKPKYIRWVWNQTARALQFVKDGQEVPEAVETIINVNDYEMARYFIKEYSLSVC